MVNGELISVSDHTLDQRIQSVERGSKGKLSKWRVNALTQSRAETVAKNSALTALGARERATVSSYESATNPWNHFAISANRIDDPDSIYPVVWEVEVFSKKRKSIAEKWRDGVKEGIDGFEKGIQNFLD